LLDEVAIAGRGKAEYLGPHEDATALVERFYQRIGKPYLTDITIDWGGMAVSEVEPAFVPDLSAFEPLVLHARYIGPLTGTVVVRGKIAGRPYEQSFKVAGDDNDPERSPIERLWARARISGLERSESWKGSQADTITTLALAHRLVTAYTSFVAIDSLVTGEAATSSIAQPNQAPLGVDIGMSGGTYAPGAVLDEVSTPYAAPRSGGCAGCTTAPNRDPKAALVVLTMMLGALWRRRSRT
jgi:Ca-activated chloride channel family protein